MSDAWNEREKALEDEHFRRKDREALEKLRQQAMADAAALKCPKCDGTLHAVNFEEVQIDRCDKCGGVWLDSGELEQLTKREEESGGWLNRFRRNLHPTD